MISITAKREKHLVVRCLDCGTLKRFHTQKDYKLWSEQQPDETQEQAQGQYFRPEQKAEANRGPDANPKGQDETQGPAAGQCFRPEQNRGPAPNPTGSFGYRQDETQGPTAGQCFRPWEQNRGPAPNPRGSFGYR